MHLSYGSISDIEVRNHTHERYKLYAMRCDIYTDFTRFYLSLVWFLTTISIALFNYCNCRRAVWEQNIKLIREHNLEADMGQHTYRLGINEYADWVSRMVQCPDGKGRL